MFTGLVEEVGAIGHQLDLPEAMRLTVRGPLVSSDAKLGDSIAVNGVCLTVVELPGNGEFIADVMRETLDRSTFQKLERGHRVNLERAVTPMTRLGGHVVQGHVDGTGRLHSKTPAQEWEEYWFVMPDDIAHLVALKGSITIDGVSLTVSGLREINGEHQFQVSLIPTTLRETTLGSLEAGSPVNLEVDVIARYLDRRASLGR